MGVRFAKAGDGSECIAKVDSINSTRADDLYDAYNEGLLAQDDLVEKVDGANITMKKLKKKVKNREDLELSILRSTERGDESTSSAALAEQQTKTLARRSSRVVSGSSEDGGRSSVASSRPKRSSGKRKADDGGGSKKTRKTRSGGKAGGSSSSDDDDGFSGDSDGYDSYDDARRPLPVPKELQRVTSAEAPLDLCSDSDDDDAAAATAAAACLAAAADDLASLLRMRRTRAAAKPAAARERERSTSSEVLMYSGTGIADPPTDEADEDTA